MLTRPPTPPFGPPPHHHGSPPPPPPAHHGWHPKPPFLGPGGFFGPHMMAKAAIAVAVIASLAHGGMACLLIKLAHVAVLGMFLLAAHFFFHHGHHHHPRHHPHWHRHFGPGPRPYPGWRRHGRHHHHWHRPFPPHGYPGAQPGFAPPPPPADDPNAKNNDDAKKDEMNCDDVPSSSDPKAAGFPGPDHGSPFEKSGPPPPPLGHHPHGPHPSCPFFGGPPSWDFSSIGAWMMGNHHGDYARPFPPHARGAGHPHGPPGGAPPPPPPPQAYYHGGPHAGAGMGQDHPFMRPPHGPFGPHAGYYYPGPNNMGPEDTGFGESPLPFPPMHGGGPKDNNSFPPPPPPPPHGEYGPDHSPFPPPPPFGSGPRNHHDHSGAPPPPLPPPPPHGPHHGKHFYYHGFYPNFWSSGF